jgi:hypothetical protein
MELVGLEPAPVPIDWDLVESWVGLRLPADYKDLASLAGPIDVGEHIWLHVPCAQASDPPYDYGRWLRDTHRSMRIYARGVPPVHPMPGGLLAWGRTRASDILFWDTGSAEDPDKWRTVIFQNNAAAAGVHPWRTYDLRMLDLLERAVTVGLSVPVQDGFWSLRPTAHRTAFLSDVGRWIPPAPRTESPEQRAALTEGSGLQALRALVPPPLRPYLGGGTWDRLFRTLGTTLPSDYVELMNAYGAGCWSNWWSFYTPLQFRSPSFAHRVAEMLDIYRELRGEFPEFYPLAVWPEPGGFLPFADTMEGDVLGWLVDGAPDDWPLIVWLRSGDQPSPLSGPLIDTLLDWLRGNLDAGGFTTYDQDDDPLDFITFQPWTDGSDQ